MDFHSEEIISGRRVNEANGLFSLFIENSLNLAVYSGKIFKFKYCFPREKIFLLFYQRDFEENTAFSVSFLKKKQSLEIFIL